MVVRIALAAATALLVPSSAAVAAPAEPPAKPPAKPPVASVRGAGDIALTFLPDDDVRSFRFDVRGAPYTRPLKEAPHGLPTDATGTVRVLHTAGDGSWAVGFSAEVDCLVTAPGSAAFTAIVRTADEPVRDWIGKRLGFSVSDRGGADRGGADRGGADRVGFSWTVVNIDQDAAGENIEGRTATCMAPAAFAPVVRGGYTVRHADLLPPPA